MEIANIFLNELKSINVSNINYTGEKNLTLEKSDLINKIKLNKYGANYLDVLDNESAIFVRQGLFKGYYDDDFKIKFDIPDYDLLLTAIHAFYVSYHED